MKKNILALGFLSIFLLTGCSDDDRREVDLVLYGDYKLVHFTKLACNNTVKLYTNNAQNIVNNPNAQNNIQITDNNSTANVSINGSIVKVKTNLDYTFDATSINDQSCKSELEKYKNTQVEYTFDLGTDVQRVNEEYIKINNKPFNITIPADATSVTTNLLSDIEFKEERAYDDVEFLIITIKDKNNNSAIGQLKMVKAYYPYPY